jgi:predicted nucleic acid-binding protein
LTDPYVDTDVLIRLITGDDPAKQRAAARLFHNVATGKLRLRAPASVIADAVFVLSSPRTYGFDRPRVRAALGPLLDLPGFEVAEQTVLRRALDLYVAHPHLDFGDAMIVAAMQLEGATELYAYDQDFDRIPGVVRLEPPAR